MSENSDTQVKKRKGYIEELDQYHRDVEVWIRSLILDTNEFFAATASARQIETAVDEILQGIRVNNVLPIYMEYFALAIAARQKCDDDHGNSSAGHAYWTAMLKRCYAKLLRWDHVELRVK